MKKEKKQLTICEFCNKNIITNEMSVPLQNNKKKSKIYIYFSCCNYYKQKTILKKEETSSLYKANYFETQYGGLSMVKRKFFLFLKTYGLREFIKNKDILEIGAATGEFLNVCQNFSPSSILGLEISQDASKVALERYGFKFITINFENYNTNKKFDTIFMFHVIEHVTDPISVIKKCNGMLKKNGVLILETPNVDSWEYTLFKEKWLAWMPREHVFLFSTLFFTSISKFLQIPIKSFIFSPMSNVLPTQVQKNKTIMTIYPLFLVCYTFFYFFSFLFKKSGIVTVIFKKSSI